MLSTGTNTELAKTSGKIATKPADCAASAPRTVSATKAKIQLSAKPKPRHDRDRSERLQQAATEPEADHIADDDHEPDDEHVAHEVGQRATGEHGRARHRHRAEAVDHAALEVFGEPDGGLVARNDTDCTQIPGRRKSMYETPPGSARPIAPPNT